MYYDWEAALKHLQDIKEKLMELPEGKAQLNILLKCNPLLERYQNGERTKDLYKSIMELE